MGKGIFITFEGPDGSGKTSVMKNVADMFIKREYPILMTKEPGSPLSDICQKLRAILLSKDETEEQISNESEIFLYMADRAHHVNKIIRPALAEGKVVLCDRYIDSTLAYQGFGRGKGELDQINFVSSMNTQSTGGLIPDLTILLTVSLNVAFKRMNSDSTRGGLDRIEKEKSDFWERVHSGYEYLYNEFKDTRKFCLIDTTDISIDQVSQKVIKVVDDLLSERELKWQKKIMKL